jgi:phosphotransferase system  glucose/maltose/N-acetylglucosamine-specific IIC component
MKKYWQCLGSWWRADFFSPKDFVRRALLIGAAFAVVQLLGWREFTSVLNGTAGSVEMSWAAAATRGLAYIFLYFAWVLIVPILLLAAGLSVAWRKFNDRRKSQYEPGTNPPPQN